MSSFLSGAQRQLVIVRYVPDYLSSVAMSPLSTLMFIAIVRSVGRSDLGANAVIAIALITSWQTGLYAAGDALARDRMMGVLELDLSAPVAFRQLVLGRTAVSTLLALIPLALCIGIGQLGYGIVVVDVGGLWSVGAVVLGTAAATMSALFCMSSVALLSGRSTALMNGLSYPLFLLAGVFVPVTYLPPWLQPLSSVVFMRWSAEGLRDAAAGDAVLVPVLWLVALGVVMLLVGFRLLDRVTCEMRAKGTAGVA